MAIGLTNKTIGLYAGQAALLPNQPILHNCHVANENTLKCGDIVALSDQAGSDTLVVVKKAVATDLPLGVVVYNPIKTGFEAGEMVSVFPDDSYVYLPASAATIKRGNKLQFTADGKVAATTTASNGYIGIAITQPSAVDDLIVVQIKASK